MTDDLAQQAPAPPPEPVPLDEPEPIAGPHIQITEAAASPLDAGEVIERRDAYGRVPVLVRIRRQPPIRVEWILIAIAPRRVRPARAAGSRAPGADHRRGGRRGAGRLRVAHPPADPAGNGGPRRPCWPARPGAQ